MKKIISTVLVAVFCLFLFSCSENTSEETQQKNNLFPEGTEFEGVGMGQNQAQSIWSLSILENDSILLIEKDIRDSVGVHFLNYQNFGKIIKSEYYHYELLFSSSINGSGCDMPSRHMDTDTIPIYIDSVLLQNSPIWSLSLKDTILKIDSSYSTIPHNTTADISFTLSPDSTSHYQPMTLSSGNRCAVVLQTTGYPNQKFYLNKTEGKYELIIEKIKYQKGNYYNKLENDTMTRIVELNIMN